MTRDGVFCAEARAPPGSVLFDASDASRSISQLVSPTTIVPTARPEKKTRQPCACAKGTPTAKSSVIARL